MLALFLLLFSLIGEACGKHPSCLKRPLLVEANLRRSDVRNTTKTGICQSRLWSVVWILTLVIKLSLVIKSQVTFQVFMFLYLLIITQQLSAQCLSRLIAHAHIRARISF